MPAVYEKTFIVPDEAVDVHGHINNLEYVKWMQEIAIEHSTAQGWGVERYMRERVSWFIRSHTIDYLEPGFAGDEMKIGTWVAAMNERTSPRRYVFVRSADGVILARAETMWACIDLDTGKAIPIPDELGSAFDVVATDEDALRIMGISG